VVICAVYSVPAWEGVEVEDGDGDGSCELYPLCAGRDWAGD